MLSLGNNKWLTESPLSKSKEKKYYYDFGTGKKVETDEFKQEKDSFLDGFNSVGTLKPKEKEYGVFNGNALEITKLPFDPRQEVKFEKLPYDPRKSPTVVQYAKGETKDPWGSSLGGDLDSNEDKELFISGFTGENKQPQIKVKKPDTLAKSALDFLYSKNNRDKAKDFLANNGLPSFEDREYNKKHYGMQEENKRMLDLLKEKTTGILNPKLPDDTDRAFLSGFLGKEEEENNYKKKLSSSIRALNELQDTFRGSQFEGVLNPTAEKVNSSPAITNAINRNPNAKNEIEHAVAYPNKEYEATQYSANSKESFIDKVLSKEVNNNIYTSKGNHYTEKSKGIIGVSGSDYYYAEKDGKRYRANSLETVNYYDWDSIDENFLNGKFLNLIDEANKKPAHILRVLTQSVGGDLDFKNKLDEKTLYLIDGVLYNKNEAGNFVWAYFLESHKYSGLFSGALAQGGTLLSSLSKMNGSARLDEEWDRKARWAGVRYYYEKNNKLPLYYYLYGDKIKY